MSNRPHARIDLSTPEDMRAAARHALDPEPSPRVFDNALNPPRSDYDLNPWLRPDLAGTPLKPAAVLVPIVARSAELTVLLTQRPDTMAQHPGQIAFPGGKMDPTDPTPVHTALREAEEEIGLERRHVEILGFLDSYQTGTGYRIVPVVALVEPTFTLTVDEREVAEAFEVPLGFLMDAANHHKHEREFRGAVRRYYAMPYGERYIWGATAGMLRNLHERLIERWPASF